MFACAGPAGRLSHPRF